MLALFVCTSLFFYFKIFGLNCGASDSANNPSASGSVDIKPKYLNPAAPAILPAKKAHTNIPCRVSLLRLLATSASCANSL